MTSRSGRALAILLMTCAAIALAAGPATAAPAERVQGGNEAPRQVHPYWMMGHSSWGMHRAPWMANRAGSTDGGDHMDDWSPAAWILMGAGMIALWALAIVGVVLLLQRRGGPKAQGV